MVKTNFNLKSNKLYKLRAPFHDSVQLQLLSSSAVQRHDFGRNNKITLRGDHIHEYVFLDISIAISLHIYQKVI